MLTTVKIIVIPMQCQSGNKSYNSLVRAWIQSRRYTIFSMLERTMESVSEIMQLVPYYTDVELSSNG